MSNYLVTGGAGFIGSNIVERLLKDGHFVRVLDNFSSGKEENLKFVSRYSPVLRSFNEGGLLSTRYSLIKGDIRDYTTCLKACQGIDYVLHQAALRSVPKSLNNPSDYNEVNIDGTLNMLKAARECGVKRFVFASSSSIYGDTDIFPEKEDAYPLLISPYALTKLAGEYYCRIFSENFGLETVSLRYFNVFGPRQAVDDEYAVVIPKFITCMLEGQSPPIHGNGKQSRDFTYVDNVVEANILAATARNTHESGVKRSLPEGDAIRNTETGISHNVFNIANGCDHTILELVDMLNNIIYPVRKEISNGMDKSIEPVFTPTRPGDVFKTLADISKVQKLLGYKPKVGFEEGLKKTVEWFKSKEETVPASVVYKGK